MRLLRALAFLATLLAACAVASAAEGDVKAIPALTAPLVVRPPSSQHWILIGSLLEDLRRIHGGLLGED